MVMVVWWRWLTEVGVEDGVVELIVEWIKKINVAWIQQCSIAYCHHGYIDRQTDR